MVAIVLVLLGCGSDAETSNATEPGSATTSQVPSSDAASVTTAPSVAAPTTAAVTAPVADRSDWGVCANRFAFETFWLRIGKEKNYPGAREELLAFGPQPGLDDAWQAMLRSLDEGTDLLDSIGPVLDYYFAILPTPCDPQGLPADFGCDLVDDCASTLASDPAARANVAGPRVILGVEDPAELSECETAESGGQRCFLSTEIEGSGSIQKIVTFTQTTDGRYFVSDIHN
jgi:hypothetical protein